MAIVCDRFDSLGFQDRTTTYRLGIMGGTFDPIHFGHLACAEQVRELFSLDAVVFIPTAQPVFKRDRQIAPATDRFKMCYLATRSNPPAPAPHFPQPFQARCCTWSGWSR